MTTAYDWTGRIGDVWAAEWRRTDRSFTNLTPHLNAAILAATPQTRKIIDIGCGAGATTLALAQALPNATVTGIDLSPTLIEIARHRAETQANARFECADITVAAADHAPTDLYVSRHGVMFFADPIAAFATLAETAAADASLVFSCFAERAANRWATETVAATGGDSDAPASTAPGPFAFADPAYVAGILATAGWRVAPPQRLDFAYRAGEGTDPVADAVDYFRRIGPAASAIRDAASEERERHIARLTDVCARHSDGDTVEFPAVAWIWTAHKSAI
ncbi:trans-aconitate 2-methyltransferase [Sphingomonas albertensis]|uniref:Class I SAM-dependent methyltransferase n=1 Tax=Sphingomonas albertensis TaxID=2762591 RepID=A0ABR7AQW4_9SPHN|nr:class I SAM-dependent methyltransferase [Sphingomonas albertensis]MBC3942853.1 class I SAM-dependent methyltransferase [Sphingomonas albertensis]